MAAKASLTARVLELYEWLRLETEKRDREPSAKDNTALGGAYQTGYLHCLQAVRARVRWEMYDVISEPSASGDVSSPEASQSMPEEEKEN